MNNQGESEPLKKQRPCASYTQRQYVKEAVHVVAAFAGEGAVETGAVAPRSPPSARRRTRRSCWPRRHLVQSYY